mmetsp:Transcript_24936/g.70042  ORF Transcript_24936/g.70042 Transcript_24936/m.70042 type:complete len:195 (-) Transcript_24936:127-711(-)
MQPNVASARTALDAAKLGCRMEARRLPTTASPGNARNAASGAGQSERTWRRLLASMVSANTPRMAQPVLLSLFRGEDACAQAATVLAGLCRRTEDTSRALRQIAAAQDIWDKVSKGRFSASWATSPTTDVSMALAALAFDLEGGCQTFDAGDQSWFTPIASKVLAPGKEARRIMALMLMALGGADDVASVALCA